MGSSKIFIAFIIVTTGIVAAALPIDGGGYIAIIVVMWPVHISNRDGGNRYIRLHLNIISKRSRMLLTDAHYTVVTW